MRVVWPLAAQKVHTQHKRYKVDTLQDEMAVRQTLIDAGSVGCEAMTLSSVRRSFETKLCSFCHSPPLPVVGLPCQVRSWHGCRARSRRTDVTVSYCRHDLPRAAEPRPSTGGTRSSRQARHPRRKPADAVDQGSGVTRCPGVQFVRRSQQLTASFIGTSVEPRGPHEPHPTGNDREDAECGLGVEHSSGIQCRRCWMPSFRLGVGWRGRRGHEREQAPPRILAISCHTDYPAFSLPSTDQTGASRGTVWLGAAGSHIAVKAALWPRHILHSAVFS